MAREGRDDGQLRAPDHADARRRSTRPARRSADWEIFAAAARAHGLRRGFDWADAAAVYDEFAALTAGRPCDQAGVSHARLDREGTIQWPCRTAEDPGTARLYTDGRFHTPDGRAAAEPPRCPATPPTRRTPTTRSSSPRAGSPASGTR